jgi:YYY domain-containing protein
MLQLLELWALVEVLGFIFLPLTVTVFHNLPDRGYAFSKAIGVAVLAFGVWLPLMTLRFLPYNQMFILGVLLILLALNILGLLRANVRQTLLKLARVNWPYLVACEVIFFGMMFLLGWIRSYVPAIYSYEMFMDEGFLAAIMRSPHLPPNDMWYAGQIINYYYYAHFTMATLGKLLGQIPSVIFNTGICTFFGLTAVNLFGVSSNIVAWARHRRRQSTASGQDATNGEDAAAQYPPLLRAAPYGLLSMAMALVLGNLAATQQWFTIHGDPAQFDWFAPSRVVPKTINEFPAFSFLLSCFHAHVLTLAFTVVAIALAFNLFLEHDGRGLFAFGRGWRLPLTLGVSALIIGGLFAMNGWDLPTYLGLALVAIVLQQWRAYDSRFRMELVLDAFTACAALAALSFFFFAPFYLTFISPSEGIGLVAAADRSPLGDELLIYGVFAFMFLSLLVATVLQMPVFKSRNSGLGASIGAAKAVAMQRQRLSGWLIALIIAILVAVAVYFILPNSATFALAAGIAACGVILILHNLKDRSLAFALLLGTTAFALIAGCEIIFLRDVFSGSLPRMNTVFKFYFQSWALLSVTSGIGLYFILERFRPPLDIPRSQRWMQRGVESLWAVGLCVLLLASAVYPLAGTYARTNHFAQRSNSLDGLDYLQNCPFYMCGYNTTGDYYAIRWINSHIQGDPVIVEAVGSDYTMYGRVSAFTGLPTIMGWVGHEYQWRVTWLNNPVNAVDFNSRQSDVQTIYTNSNPKVVLDVMARYNAQYLYVGALEQQQYPGADLSRFSAFMQVVYSFDGVTIYKVAGS